MQKPRSLLGRSESDHKFSVGKPSKRFQAQERLEIDYDLDNFEKKNPTLFAKFYSPNFENPQLFKTQQTNSIEQPPSPFRTPCFTPTFMRSSTPMKIPESGTKSLTFKPPSRPSSTVSTRPPSTSSQISNDYNTLESDNDVQFVSEFHPQKISTQSQRRFMPYKPVRSTEAVVKIENEPQTVAEIIRSQAVSQLTQVSTSSNVKNEPDVQFSFEFHPQKMSTQIPEVFFQKVLEMFLY